MAAVAPATRTASFSRRYPTSKASRRNITINCYHRLIGTRNERAPTLALITRWHKRTSSFPSSNSQVITTHSAPFFVSRRSSIRCLAPFAQTSRWALITQVSPGLRTFCERNQKSLTSVSVDAPLTYKLMALLRGALPSFIPRDLTLNAMLPRA